jgi:hypothetical protein
MRMCQNRKVYEGICYEDDHAMLLNQSGNNNPCYCMIGR